MIVTGCRLNKVEYRDSLQKSLKQKNEADLVQVIYLGQNLAVSARPNSLIFNYNKDSQKLYYKIQEYYS